MSRESYARQGPLFFNFFKIGKNGKYHKSSTGKVVYSIIITHGSLGTGGRAPRRHMLGIIPNLSLLRHQLTFLTSSVVVQNQKKKFFLFICKYFTLFLTEIQQGF